MTSKKILSFQVYLPWSWYLEHPQNSVQFRFHLPSFTRWHPRIILQRVWPCHTWPGLSGFLEQKVQKKKASTLKYLVRQSRARKTNTACSLSSESAHSKFSDMSTQPGVTAKNRKVKWGHCQDKEVRRAIEKGIAGYKWSDQGNRKEISVGRGRKAIQKNRRVN